MAPNSATDGRCRPGATLDGLLMLHANNPPTIRATIARVSGIRHVNDAVDESQCCPLVLDQRSEGPAVVRCSGVHIHRPAGIDGARVHVQGINEMLFRRAIDQASKKSDREARSITGVPVDVNARAKYNGGAFTSLVQNQRAALGLVNGIVYVPYSGHSGDCGLYRGWVVRVQIDIPSSARLGRQQR